MKVFRVVLFLECNFYLVAIQFIVAIIWFNLSLKSLSDAEIFGF